MTADLQLRDQVAIVTGGASGIGKAIATVLSNDGARVFIVDKDADLAKRAIEEMPFGRERCVFRNFDLLDYVGIEKFVETIRAEAGRIDILVNSAGIIDSEQSMLKIDLEVWDKVYCVNLKAPMLFMKAAAAVMVRDKTAGRIVNITSSSAFRAVMSYPAYGSSKAALTQLTRSAAADLGPYNINVNCVAPGITRTPLLSKIDIEARMPALLESGPLANLLRRLSEPEDVAAAVLFLCSVGGRQITGQTIHTSAGAVV